MLCNIWPDKKCGGKRACKKQDHIMEGAGHTATNLTLTRSSLIMLACYSSYGCLGGDVSVRQSKTGLGNANTRIRRGVLRHKLLI